MNTVSPSKATIRSLISLITNRSKARRYTTTYKGGTYRFASAAHKKSFESNPAKYAPQFGGFCGYAASINKLAPIEVEYFQVLHGRLVMQHNEKAWKLWHEDVEGNLRKADANWPKLSQEKPTMEEKAK